MASLLGSLTDGLKITDYDDWVVFTKRLQDLLRSGRIRRIAPLPNRHFMPSDEWYLDPEAGEIYVHGLPEAPMLPSWERFDIVAHSQRPKPHPNDLSVIPKGKKSSLEAEGIKDVMGFLTQQLEVEAVSPTEAQTSMNSTEHWYRDLKTGIVYRLVEPKGEGDIRWERVPPNELQAKTQ